jgi:hypothetical protein
MRLEDQRSNLEHDKLQYEFEIEKQAANQEAANSKKRSIHKLELEHLQQVKDLELNSLQQELELIKNNPEMSYFLTSRNTMKTWERVCQGGNSRVVFAPTSTLAPFPSLR